MDGKDMEAILEERAQQLFLLSDQERKGFIVKRDMQRMRSEVPLSPEQLEAVFDSLDVNNNGYLTIEQFLSGFGEFVASHSRSTWGSEEVMESTETDGREVVESLLQELETINIVNNVGMLRQLCHDAETVPRLEIFLKQLVADLKRCQDEQRNLEEALRVKDDEHKQQVRRLFEEMESQLDEEKTSKIRQEEQRLRMKREMVERDVSEKERQLQDALSRQQELSERVQALRSREVQLKEENERLRKTKEELGVELETQHHELVQLQQFLADVRQNEEWERRKHLSAGFRLAKRIMLEQQGLMHQLTLLQGMTSTLEREDERDQRVHKTSQDMSDSSEPSAFKFWKKCSYNRDSEEDFYEGTGLVMDRRPEDTAD